jgi:hypothetical protein
MLGDKLGDKLTLGETLGEALEDRLGEADELIELLTITSPPSIGLNVRTNSTLARLVGVPVIYIDTLSPALNLVINGCTDLSCATVTKVPSCTVSAVEVKSKAVDSKSLPVPGVSVCLSFSIIRVPAEPAVPCTSCTETSSQSTGTIPITLSVKVFNPKYCIVKVSL